MNILFVERDGSLRRMVKDMLVQAGASVTEITGATGLRSLTEVPELAIVEVELGGEGMAAIVRLRAGGPDSPPIVALAAESGLVEPCRAAGADRVLVEPVAFMTLFDAIGPYLPRHD